ncbi:senecionine N-oxygenase-like [Bradysia coprophila]|uniref:senecionine N-oxygenase-like n=1 Tax=Bradysia coprophila TaxID=38358 RepID=UPI00187D7F6D|nr:senecionine N-oxygenase-like [Bradysia coprophila]
MKIAVIGAGAAGLAAIKHAIEINCDVIGFEQTDKVGGTWVYTPQTGKNEFGIDIHSSMYQNLTTNLPIELMCYPNEPFPSNPKSFVSSDVVLSYYESFADKYRLRDHIKFLNQVVRVRPLSQDYLGGWEVIVRDVSIGTYETYTFDAVLVCNGHFHSGFIPNYEGAKTFQGKRIHSHNYRSPEVFKDETILVIGGNFSAVDIVQQTAPHVKSVIWSHHLKNGPDVTLLGENVTQKPDVLKLGENNAVFVDNTTSTITTVIYCTGYEFKFPFLSVDCGISSCDGYVRPLFKHCLNINRPTMGFIGLPNLVCPNQLFSLQSRFCLSFMTGKKALPTKEEMIEDTETDLNDRWKRGLPKRKAHMMGLNVQAQYYADLATTAAVEPIKPVIPRMHIHAGMSRQRDFVNFRSNKYHVIDDETFEARPI